jgi:succinate dehydrogenase / fumarate reductase cytochrome b subunit
MLVAVVLHAWTALTLTNLNSAARKVGYRVKQHQAATFASRSMRYSGVILGLFIIYHLLHLTTGTLHPDFIKGDAYHNFVTGFQKPLAAAFYIVAQICLGFHLWHGVWSFTQSLGWAHPRYNTLRRTLAGAFALVIAVVNISFPIAVLTGLIHL